MTDTNEIFDGIVAEAIGQCEHDKHKHNLMLTRDFEATALDYPFDGIYESIAKDWQNLSVPVRLHFSHGQFIHRGGNGIQYVVEELRRKRDSNRALVSLIDMEDLMRSGDRPIPSFMTLQFGIVDTTLYCTAYFRALEVSRFLPINLTEACQIMRQIHEAFPDIKNISLVIHAFRAYHNEDFDCLQKAEMDQLSRGEIAMAVNEMKIDLIRMWLEDKSSFTTVIDVGGIEELLTSVRIVRKRDPKAYTENFESNLVSALASLKRIETLRKTASHSEGVAQAAEEFNQHAHRAIVELTK